jgi:hypothetical protein
VPDRMVSGEHEHPRAYIGCGGEPVGDGDNQQA